MNADAASGFPTPHAAPSHEKGQWYALYTRSRFEKKLHAALKKNHFEVFLPLIKDYRRWSDRVKLVEVPLLPGYVFVKLPANQLDRLYYYPGFVRIVSFAGKPSAVREQEIHLLQEIATHGFSVQPATDCTVGKRVRIIHGPLKGWEGKVENKLGKSRIVFQFESIRQALSVEVECGDVEVVEMG